MGNSMPSILVPENDWFPRCGGYISAHGELQGDLSQSPSRKMPYK